MTRLRLALAGLLGVAVLLAASVSAIAYRSGVFGAGPELTLVVPASAGPLRPQSPVQYRGIVVGTVSEVEAGTGESKLTLEISGDSLAKIPAAVKARLLPRTLFGDQYVDLVAPDDQLAPGLRAGGTIPHDDSAPTAQLYTTATRLYDLISALHPAELSAALGAVADTLRGKGNQIGDLIDSAHDLAGDTKPLTDQLLKALPGVATLTDQLAASAPDLFATLDNAVALSGTLVAHKEDLRRLLAAGIDTASTTESLLVDNSDRVIRLVRNASPLVGTISSHPGALTSTVDNLGNLLDAVTRAFQHGPWVAIKAPLTLDNPYPYTAADCPRYGDLAGPNCTSQTPAQPRQTPQPQQQTAGGTVGPVGSDTEKNEIDQLIGPQQQAPSSPDLLTVLFGPLLRGATVVSGG
ncbi:MCE family protein [Amycolatopsis acidicola]|uniref:MCE family protein n=1 Tax=Amycolatopsis acidicola TaxID=2596893 RepID=A0A5N0UM58_9PSEU|nr:MCE family protein [Amycolatopsis acidicola]KAA9151157.1 MCE family protein [Amycolatopsis acidicola]